MCQVFFGHPVYLNLQSTAGTTRNIREGYKTVASWSRADEQSMKKQVMASHWRGETNAVETLDSLSETEELAVEEEARVQKNDGRGHGQSSSARKGYVWTAERLTIVSVVLTLEKIQDHSGSDTVYELIQLLRDKNFNLSLFKDMVCCRVDCRKISEKFIAERSGE